MHISRRKRTGNQCKAGNSSSGSASEAGARDASRRCETVDPADSLGHQVRPSPRRPALTNQ